MMAGGVGIAHNQSWRLTFLRLQGEKKKKFEFGADSGRWKSLDFTVGVRILICWTRWTHYCQSVNLAACQLPHPIQQHLEQRPRIIDGKWFRSKTLSNQFHLSSETQSIERSKAYISQDSLVGCSPWFAFGTAGIGQPAQNEIWPCRTTIAGTKNSNHHGLRCIRDQRSQPKKQQIHQMYSNVHYGWIRQWTPWTSEDQQVWVILWLEK